MMVYEINMVFLLPIGFRVSTTPRTVDATMTAIKTRSIEPAISKPLIGVNFVGLIFKS